MAKSPPPPIHFDIRDPDQFADQIGNLGTVASAETLVRDRFRVTTLGTRLPHVSVFLTRVSNGRISAPPERGYLSLTVPLNKAVGIADHTPRETFEVGSAHLLQNEAPFSIECGQEVPVLVVNFDQPFVEERWGPLTGSEAPCVGHLDRRLTMASPGGADLWKQLSAACRLLQGLRPRPRTEAGLVELEELLLSALVSATVPGPEPRHGTGGVPASMRHAEAYIASCLTRSLSPADVANQAGVSYRTLRRWFQRKWGMGPVAFHKRRRLEAVERVLLGETRDSTTVSKVAFDHGFWHLGHFCADYKGTFGETPSTTLGPTGRIHGETFGDPTDA
jgi:AraC-like DNA-binding protein